MVELNVVELRRVCLGDGTYLTKNGLEWCGRQRTCRRRTTDLD